MVNVAKMAYDAWGDERVQAATEKKIETAIYNGANANAADDRGMSALHWAAEYDWPSLVHLLVNAHRFPPNPDTDINVRVGGSGRTALMLACNEATMSAWRCYSSMRPTSSWSTMKCPL